MAKLYRKKPVVIEAHQYLGTTDSKREIIDLLRDSKTRAFMDTEVRNYSAEYPDGFDFPVLKIQTLEGDHKVSISDWVIIGVQGEAYPCKPDIFEMTYESATLQLSDTEDKLAIAIEAIKDYQAKCAKSEPVAYRQTIHCEYKGETKIQYGYSEFQVMKGDTPLYDKPQSSDAEYRLAEAMKILNQIATMPRKTRERNLAYSFVTFIEAMQSEKIVKS